MLTLRLAHENELKNIFALYKRAFPRTERPPSFMFKRSMKKIKIYSLVDDNILQGMMMVTEHNGMVYLDYFAIMESFRSSGIGSLALNLLFDLYPGKRIALSIEGVDDPKSRNTEERVKRKNFYLRNGFEDSGLCLSLITGPDMEILCKNGTISYEEYKNILIYAFGKFYFSLLRVRQIAKN